MLGLSKSEFLFYGGISFMAIAAAAGVWCGFIFRMTGRKINRELQQEYGEWGRSEAK